MPNKRSPRKLEERLAKKYVYQNSVVANRNNSRDEVRERIYVGTPDDVVAAVLAEAAGDRSEDGVIPFYPQGLVISDSRGGGFFDVQMS